MTVMFNKKLVRNVSYEAIDIESEDEARNMVLSGFSLIESQRDLLLKTIIHKYESGDNDIIIVTTDELTEFLSAELLIPVN